MRSLSLGRAKCAPRPHRTGLLLWSASLRTSEVRGVGGRRHRPSSHAVTGYVVTVWRVDTGEVLDTSRHDTLADALASKRRAFRRHHHVDLGGLAAVPFDADFDDFDEMQARHRGRPPLPLPIASTITSCDAS